MIPPVTFNRVAQAGHFAGGLAVVWGLHILWHAGLLGLIGVIAFAAVKEFWWDYRYESPEVRGSSVTDFVFWTVGACGAFAVLMFKGVR